MRACVVALATLAACGYQSRYTPVEGRPHLLWRDGHVHSDLPALSAECANEVAQSARDPGSDVGPSAIDVVRSYYELVRQPGTACFADAAANGRTLRLDALVIDDRRGGLTAWSNGRRVARSPNWRGLDDYVRCVPSAYAMARHAHRDGNASRAMLWMGIALAAGSFASLGGLADRQHGTLWVTGGLLVGAGGAILAAAPAESVQDRANGEAIDAINAFNDSDVICRR